MKFKRLTERKDHLVAEGKASVTKMIDGSAIILAVEQDKGSCANHYNRAILGIDEALIVAKQIIKTVVKHKIKQLFRREK